MRDGNEAVTALPARYYTEPAVFEREKDVIFARTWQFAGHESLVANPGDYFTFSIVDQNFFCIRGADGKVRTFFNVCQHRAHELVTGQGSCKALVCPYHAWSYELDGRFRNGPNIGVVPEHVRRSIHLKEVRTESLFGFVFVNMDDNAAPMESWFPGLRDELGDFVPGIARLKPLLEVPVAEKCNWKVSVENHSECYHCVLNHPTFSTGVVRPDSYDVRPHGHSLRHTTESVNLDRMTYPIDLKANPHAGEYSTWFLWPTFAFQVYPGSILNTYHWKVEDRENVTVVRGWYSDDGAESSLVRKLAAQDRETTVEEDVRIVEAVQRGLRSRGYRPGPLVVDPKGGVNSEHAIKALRDWTLEALGA
jgi:carnitine monooxygenase subunit